jgi:2-polyprenyl-6-methoxyphenol hydroxylase-like FAD-dependent oxidoreductase
VLPLQIVGAGIGGLSAALALACKGFKVNVHERTRELRETGAGIQLGPNAFRALEELGLQHAIERIAFEPQALVLLDSPSGTEICRQELGRPFLERFGYSYRVGYRADVQQVLLQAAREYRDRITLHLGSEIRTFSEDERGVTLKTQHGTRVRGSALIGADGLWSAIRGTIIGDGRPRTPGHIAYRAVLPVDHVPPELLTDNVQIWAGPKHHLVCYKLRAGTLFNIVAIFQSSHYVEGWDSVADIQDLQAGFEEACPAVKHLLQHVHSWRMWVLCDRDPTPGWSVGHATLLGDAAHPTLPYLAQGACMAIEDAVCLAHCLHQQPDNIPVALSEYERARLARTAHVQRVSRQMGEINHATGAAREARNRALAARNPRDYESNAWLFDPEASSADARSKSLSFWSPPTSTH